MMWVLTMNVNTEPTIIFFSIEDSIKVYSNKTSTSSPMLTKREESCITYYNLTMNRKKSLLSHSCGRKMQSLSVLQWSSVLSNYTFNIHKCSRVCWGLCDVNVIIRGHTHRLCAYIRVPPICCRKSAEPLRHNKVWNTPTHVWNAPWNGLQSLSSINRTTVPLWCVQLSMYVCLFWAYDSGFIL